MRVGLGSGARRTRRAPDAREHGRVAGVDRRAVVQPRAHVLRKVAGRHGRGVAVQHLRARAPARLSPPGAQQREVPQGRAPGRSPKRSPAVARGQATSRKVLSPGACAPAGSRQHRVGCGAVCSKSGARTPTLRVRESFIRARS